MFSSIDLKGWYEHFLLKFGLEFLLRQTTAAKLNLTYNSASRSGNRPVNYKKQKILSSIDLGNCISIGGKSILSNRRIQNMIKVQASTDKTGPIKRLFSISTLVCLKWGIKRGDLKFEWKMSKNVLTQSWSQYGKCLFQL